MQGIDATANFCFTYKSAFAVADGDPGIPVAQSEQSFADFTSVLQWLLRRQGVCIGKNLCVT